MSVGQTMSLSNTERRKRRRMLEQPVLSAIIHLLEHDACVEAEIQWGEIHLPSKRLIISLNNTNLMATYVTVNKHNSCKFDSHLYFNIDLNDPESIPELVSKVKEFKHPTFGC